jgi:hypothetical protein
MWPLQVSDCIFILSDTLWLLSGICEFLPPVLLYLGKKELLRYNTLTVALITEMAPE